MVYVGVYRHHPRGSTKYLFASSPRGCGNHSSVQQLCVQKHLGRTDHLETRALPEGPGSVGGPMRCPWYLFHRLF
ncbi:unnamed protein product [Staurois parvus]|uniref:Uncharacterized protein n=1 Tax=Staurois parvus TaxID=386267 RepID=A0ABN9B746_9NEOB|nr:unnamed protein product [Staurois parvus]